MYPLHGRMGNQMFSGMQDFNFAQIGPNFGLDKFTHSLPNLPKFYPNLPNTLARGCGQIPCIPSSYGTDPLLPRNFLHQLQYFSAYLRFGILTSLPL